MYDLSQKDTCEKYLKKWEKLKGKKQRWLEMFQYVGEYVHTKKVNFTTQTEPGSFLNKDIFDSTGPKASKKMAASLIGLLWQNGGKSIQMEPPEELQNPKKEELDFYKFMSEKTANAYDDPKAGFPLVLEEYANDQTCFGTSGVFTEDGEKQGTLLRFKAVGVDSWCFDEGVNGTITKAYGEKKVSIEAAAEEYGLEALSEKSRDMFNCGKGDEEITILHVIEPRLNIDPTKANNLNMPFKSVHIEVANKHIIKESGYHEMPAGIVRIAKRQGEIYGRSPAMDALPDILTLNQVREDRLVANEKRLEPPLGMYSDSLLGSNQVDTSPRGINVFNPQGKAAGKGEPIWPLYAVGDINAADQEITDLKESINEHFMVDRLLDFNNQTQMTATESQMRAQIRGEGIVPIAMRQTLEGFIPWIERGVAILYRKGEFGAVPNTDIYKQLVAAGRVPRKIPERIAKLMLEGKEFYKIKFVTPAARLMQAEEAQGIFRTVEFSMQLMQAFPEARDNINADEVLERVASAWGAKVILRDEKSRDELRAQAQAAQAQMAEAQAQAAQNELDKGGAEAEIMGAEAAQVEEAI